MSLANSATNVARALVNLFRRDHVQWPSRATWVIYRLSGSLVVTICALVAVHNNWGHGQVMGTGGIHAVPGMPAHEFWCVVVLASVLRTALFALFLSTAWNAADKFLRQRQNLLVDFQARHGDDEIIRAAFEKEHGGPVILVFNALPVFVLLMGSSLVLIPQIGVLLGLEIGNASFLWGAFVIMAMLVFLAVFFAALTGVLWVLFTTVNRLVSTLTFWRTGATAAEFDSLPKSEREAFDLRLKNLGVVQADNELKRAAVSSYKGRLRKAHAQAEQLDLGTPQAPSKAPRQRL